MIHGFLGDNPNVQKSFAGTTSSLFVLVNVSMFLLRDNLKNDNILPVCTVQLYSSMQVVDARDKQIEFLQRIEAGTSNDARLKEVTGFSYKVRFTSHHVLSTTKTADVYLQFMWGSHIARTRIRANLELQCFVLHSLRIPEQTLQELAAVPVSHIAAWVKQLENKLL